MVGQSIYLFLFTAFLIITYSTSQGMAVGILTNPLFAFSLMLTGAFMSAFISGKARLVPPASGIGILQGLAGGLIMGAGLSIARLPFLANTMLMVGGVFYWISFIMPQGFVYLAGVIAGGALASFLLKRCYSSWKPAPLSPITVETIKKAAIVLFLFMEVFILSTIIKMANSGDFALKAVVLWTLAAVLGGFFLERNRMCMALMMKELFLARSGRTAIKMILVAFILAVCWNLRGVAGPLAPPPGWATLAGSFMMGLGFILADGCFMGSLWKSGQGNITSCLALLGIFAGAGLSKAGWLTALAGKMAAPIGPGRLGAQELLVKWPEYAVKTGLIFLFSVWVLAYILEPPKKAIKSGSRIIWLLSEAAVLLAILTALLAPKTLWPPVFLVLGLILFLAGIAIYIWARISLGDNWGEAILLREGHQIVTRGPYRFFKHPIYIAMVLGLTGVNFLLGSVWGLASTYTLVLPSLIFRAREERRLLSALPEGRKYFEQG